MAFNAFVGNYAHLNSLPDWTYGAIHAWEGFFVKLMEDWSGVLENPPFDQVKKLTDGNRERVFFRINRAEP